jgi:multiple sugar transport system ATP-binding protein
VHLAIDPNEEHVFSTETGRRISGDEASVGSGGASRVGEG